MQTYRSSPGDREQRRIAEAWNSRCEDLADWAWSNLVCRIDRYGAHRVLRDDSVKRWTAWGLTFELLASHFAAGVAASAEQIIGVHVTDPDERCRWIAIDIDKHGDENAEDNLQFAKRILKRTTKANLTAVLIDSSGGCGGYHIWILFDRPIPMADARRLLLWLSRRWAKFGLPRRPDLFPSNDHLTGAKCGAWLRLPGRRHKRPSSWSRIWCPRARTWLEGKAAVDALLALRGGPVDVSAIVPESFGKPVRIARPRRRGQLDRDCDDGDEFRDLSLARDALRFYPDDDLDYDDWLEILMALRQFDEPGRELCHDWTQESGKYDPADLDRRWDSFEAGDAHPLGEGHWVTVATLFRRALDAGWPGPAVYPLHYPIDFRERRGPILIVRGQAAFQALESRGHMVIGLPERDQPCLRQVVRLIEGDTRAIVFIGHQGAWFDPEPIARRLENRLGVEVKVCEPPAPFQDVATWLASLDHEDHERGEG